MFFKETMIYTPSSTPQQLRATLEVPQEESNDDLRGGLPKDPQKPLPLRSVLTRPVLISIAHYAILELLSVACLAFIPLVIWSTSVEFGGLDMRPASISLLMSIFGWMDGLFRFAVFPHAVGGGGGALWPARSLASPHVPSHRKDIGSMGCASSTPSKRSLGTANGLARTGAAVRNTFGPAAADWALCVLPNNILVSLALACGKRKGGECVRGHAWNQGCAVARKGESSKLSAERWSSGHGEMLVGCSVLCPVLVVHELPYIIQEGVQTLQVYNATWSGGNEGWAKLNGVLQVSREKRHSAHWYGQGQWQGP
ncbi:hypothetical protein BJV74DRAFT_990190 [Russula compacta]|nr:hypothetical protein BJV74DRAFT_990190 [Russula compacta]